MEWNHVFWLIGVLPHSRNDFTTPEDLNPLCQHVPPLLRGDLGVDVSVVELKVVWHVGIPHSGPEVADLLITGLKGPCEVVNAGAGGGELLGGDGGASLHRGGKAVCHCACDFAEFVSAEANEGLS